MNLEIEFKENKRFERLKLGLFGGSRRGDYYPQQMVGGRPVYYDDRPFEPQNVARAPAARPGNVYDDTSSDVYISQFTNRQIRHDFVKKVYCILFIQLGFTAAIIALFVFEPKSNAFARRYFYVPMIFLGVALVFYFILVCFMSCRRNYPTNIILLSIYTILSAIGYGGLAARYAPDIVLYSFAITAAVCLVITLLAMQKWIDITGWGMYLCVIGLVASLLGLACMIMMLIMGWNDTTRIVYLVYASIAALITSLYFMYMTQLILGGKKYELSPEEYVLGAIILFTDIMHLFLLILSIFGAAR